VGIHKSGDEYLLSNYRPITLLSCLYKIIASIMATRVSDLCEEASLFTEINYGFRKSKSALSKVAQLDNVIHHAKRNKNPLFIFSSDIKNAFPTMPPSAVETTLKSVGFDDKTTAFLVNLQLNMRGTARTPFGGKTDSHQWWKSEFLGDTTGEDYSFISEAGIAQGSPLSPLLFILVFDTFMRYLEKVKKGYNYEWESSDTVARTKSTHTVVTGTAFADDLNMYSNSLNEIQEMASQLDDFIKACKMKLSPTKCELRSNEHAAGGSCIRRIFLKDGNVTHEIIDKTNQTFKYLGYITSADGDWSAHREHTKNKFIAALKRLEKSKVDDEGIIKLINEDVISTLPYRSAVVPLTEREIM
jgi:hypothetical protein